MCDLRHRLTIFHSVKQTWDWVHFWVYLLYHNSLCQLTDIIQGNNVQEFFKQLERLGLSFNTPTCSNYSIINYVKIPLFHLHLLSHSSLSHQTCPIDSISQGNNFQKFFKQFKGLGLSYNIATCSKYLIINYVKIPLFHFFQKVNRG